MSDDTSLPKNPWEADTTHPEEAERLRQNLREVADPELGLSIVELGLVREVRFEDTEVHIKMILTTPFCPYGPAMLDMARTKAEEVTGLTARMELGMDMWSPDMMEEGAGAAWGLF